MDHQTVPPLAPEQDGALIAELSVRLRRRPDASSLQFILNVAQLLGQSAHNAPLLLPLLPMILHGMARHLESDGVQACRCDLELDNCTRTAHALCLHSSCTRLALRVRITRTARALYTQECGVGLFANLAVPRGSRSSLVANGCLQHAFLSLRQYPDNPMLHRNSFRLLRNVFVAAGHADADADADSYPSPGEGAAGAGAAGEPAAEELELAAFLLQRRSLEPLAAALQRHIDDEGVAAQALACFWSLSTVASLADAMLQAGASHLLLAGMRRHLASPEVQRCGCGALAQIVDAAKQQPITSSPASPAAATLPSPVSRPSPASGFVTYNSPPATSPLSTSPAAPAATATASPAAAASPPPRPPLPWPPSSARPLPAPSRRPTSA